MLASPRRPSHQVATFAVHLDEILLGRTSSRDVRPEPSERFAAVVLLGRDWAAVLVLAAWDSTLARTLVAARILLIADLRVPLTL
jgi:hypothetical protein